MTSDAPTVRMNAVLPADVEADFRAAVAARKGVKKGNLSEALAEAIRLWIDSPRREPIPQTPQDAATRAMKPIERMELAYKLSRYAGGIR